MESSNKPWVLIIRNGFLTTEKGPFIEGVGEELIGEYDTYEEADAAWLAYIGGSKGKDLIY